MTLDQVMRGAQSFTDVAQRPRQNENNEGHQGGFEAFDGCTRRLMQRQNSLADREPNEPLAAPPDSPRGSAW